MVKEITINDWDECVINSDKITLVDITASWCGPCKVLGPIIDNLSENNKDYNFYKLNVDDNRELVNSLGVRNVPTCIIFNEGQIVDRFVGVLPAERILEKLNAI